MLNGLAGTDDFGGCLGVCCLPGSRSQHTRLEAQSLSLSQQFHALKTAPNLRGHDGRQSS
jgi:hypothetical protein